MGVGHELEAEWQSFTDPETGRLVREYTTDGANSYPLYYFIDSITPPAAGKPDYLVFHSERTSWVQLYRMDLGTGAITQLTAGTTSDSGWAPWCEPRLRGIHNHLSALNAARREAFYFQDETLYGVNLDTLETRVARELPGRICVSQNGFSPDGRFFAFVHADRATWNRWIADTLAVRNMVPERTRPGAWRRGMPCTIGLLDVRDGTLTTVAELDFLAHHVFFVDEDRLLLNHLRDHNGMWLIHRDGSGARELRPPDENGGVCHQVAHARGLDYEAPGHDGAGKTNHMGRYDLARDTYEEIPVPYRGYIHTGRDPAGRFAFFEHHEGADHEIVALHHPRDPDRRSFETLRRMAPYPACAKGQRFHAHPFLSPRRDELFYTEVVDGRSRIRALDVGDLVDAGDGWD